MSGYSELIKNFAKTRDYVRDFFIYGCKVRRDFTRKSSRTYDDEKRRVESWLGDALRYDDSVRGRQISISVDSGHSHDDPLRQAYWSKSFTDNDIRLHFCLPDVFEQGEWLTLREITDRLDRLFPEPFDVQTVRNKLREYVSEGIFLTRRRGRTSYFSLSPDETMPFIQRFPGLDDGVRFFSGSQEFGVVGSTIMNACAMKNDCFLTKHSYIVHTLEDEIVLSLVTAIDEQRTVELVSFGDPEHPRLVVPMQILSSLQTGRRYIAAWEPATERFTSSRLDYIKEVRHGEVCGEYDSLYQSYLAAAQRSFGVSFGQRGENVEPLRLTITLDESEEPYILDRLERERRCGELQRLSPGLYALTFDVADPREIMGWAKSFIGRIVSIEGGTEDVRELFLSDIRRMAEMYGGDGDDNIQ